LDDYHELLECSKQRVCLHHSILFCLFYEGLQLTPIPSQVYHLYIVAYHLGMGDSTCLWVAQLVGKEVRLIDFVENHGVGLDWYVNWLKENRYERFDQYLPHDVEVRELGTGKSRKEVLQEAGLDITVAPRLSVADGIQAVRRLLPRCWFDKEKTKQGVNALRNYRREHDEKRNVYYEKPLHDWCSHAADSFRYLAITLDESADSWSSNIPINTKWVV